MAAGCATRAGAGAVATGVDEGTSVAFDESIHRLSRVSPQLTFVATGSSFSIGVFIHLTRIVFHGDYIRWSSCHGLFV